MVSKGNKMLKFQGGLVVLFLLSLIVIVFASIIGVNRYMNQQKSKQLYQHGFRLYEEQIATYIIENYSGVKKVEFSPIFIRQSEISNANIVPVIYDEYGNKEFLGETGKGTGEFALHNGIELDRDGATDEEIIELIISPGHFVEVQGYDSLPDKAKKEKSEVIDLNISKLVKEGYLEGIEKNTKGSPYAKIIYNTEIKKGDYRKWR